MFITVKVGRSNSADIQIEGETVSRFHMEVTLTPEGRYYGIDRNSSHGTYIWRDDKWKPFIQGYLVPGAHLGLGKTKVPVDDLIQRLREVQQSQGGQALQFEPVSIKPRRNTETGEVEE